MESNRENLISREELIMEAEARIKLKRMKRYLTSAVIIALAMLVVAGLAWSASQKRSKAKVEAEINALKEELEKTQKAYEEAKNNPMVVNPVAPEISLDVINAEIREIGELATMEYLYTDAGRYSNSWQIFKKFNVPLTEKSFTMKWDGVIKAGIEVDQITTALNEEEKVLTVYLPEAKILSHDPDRDSVEIFDERDGIFNPVRVEDQVTFDAASEKAMEERAIENGLLEKAQENAKLVIQSILHADPGIKEQYKIEFAKVKK